MGFSDFFARFTDPLGGNAGGSGATPPFVNGGTQQPSATQPRWLQSLQNYAPYALLGLAGSRGGMGGTLAAAGMAALISGAKQAQRKRTLQGALTTGPTQEQAGFDPNSGLPGVGLSAPTQDDYGYRKGGKMRAFSGKPVKAKPLKKSDGGQISAVHEVNATRQLERVGRMGASIPHVAPFRAHGTGRFVKGGLVRGMGCAIKGTGFKGEL